MPSPWRVAGALSRSPGPVASGYAPGVRTCVCCLLLACRPVEDKAVSPDTAEGTWTVSDETLVWSGGYADPSAVDTELGWDLYVNRSAGPDKGTFRVSTLDGVSLTDESPLLLIGAATARAVVMDGGVRLYYPASAPATTGRPPDGEDLIYSAWASDGLAFTDDPGARLRAPWGEPGGPALLQLDDGSWRFWVDLSEAGATDPAVLHAEIWGGSSPDGLDWTLDEAPTLVGEEGIEGTAPEAQVLHPFVFAAHDSYWMFYNAHAALYLARSSDGLAWEKLGPLGLDGADLCAAALDDGRARIWYGRYSEETQGEIYTAILDLPR